MCIIIDTNALSAVFNPADRSHPEFEPVSNWILAGKGKIVYGGTKYTHELGKMGKYLPFFVELQKKNKLVRVDDVRVDGREKEIKKMKQHSGFNDEHLIAIVIESGCRLVCTEDKASLPFIKDPVFYPKNCKRPKIYSGKKQNKELLADCNIAPICKD